MPPGPGDQIERITPNKIETEMPVSHQYATVKRSGSPARVAVVKTATNLPVALAAILQIDIATKPSVIKNEPVRAAM